MRETYTHPQNKACQCKLDAPKFLMTICPFLCVAQTARRKHPDDAYQEQDSIRDNRSKRNSEDIRRWNADRVELRPLHPNKDASQGEPGDQQPLRHEALHRRGGGAGRRPQKILQQGDPRELVKDRGQGDGSLAAPGRGRVDGGSDEVDLGPQGRGSEEYCEDQPLAVLP